jgi:signal transduction histidine kinase
MYVAVGRAADAADARSRYRDVVVEQSVPQRVVAWYRGLNPWAVDACVTTLLVVIALITTADRGTIPQADYQPMNALGIVLVLGASVPYLFLRRAPLPVLVVTATSVAAITWIGYNEGSTPIYLYGAAIAVGASRDQRKVIAGAVYLFVVLTALVLFGDANFDGGTYAVNLAIFAAMLMIGFTIRSRRERIDALEERAEAVAREQEEESRRAVTDERLRIARELHDVVAHSMGVIAVQAGVGEHVLDDDPAEAKRALQAISGVSRSALAEIRRMLGALREDGDSTSYAPAPGLDELERLTKELDGAGVPVDVAFTGARVELPRGVDLTAYRIVQEALTNVLKHAGPARASVLVGYEPHQVRLEITDDGRGVNGRASGGGHGLVGMHERVAVYGGTLQTGPQAGGGFKVVACLPFGETS